MNWLTNVVRPKLQQLVRRTEVPDNLWTQCPACASMLFRRDLERNLHCCTNCGHHFRIGPAERIAMLMDPGWQEAELPETLVDPLKFRDTKRYTARLEEARGKSARKDAVVVAHGTIDSQPAVVACFDFGFMGGSMGIAAGEAILVAARLAVLQKAALVAVPASGGARMQEGILSLMQMPRTTVGVSEVKEAGLPYIVVLTDPTTGGVSASFAMLGDIQIAETGAAIGFAGRRVIEGTIREQLPDNFQRAEYLLEHGMLDIVVERKDLRPTLARVLDLLMRKGPAAAILPAPMPSVDIPEPPEAGGPAADGASGPGKPAPGPTAKD